MRVLSEASPNNKYDYTSPLRLREIEQRGYHDDLRKYVTLNNYAVPLAVLDLDGDADDADPYYLTPTMSGPRRFDGPGESHGDNPLGWGPVEYEDLRPYSTYPKIAGSSASQLDRRHKQQPTACTRRSCSRWLLVLLVCILAGATAGGVLLGLSRRGREESTEDEGSAKAQVAVTPNVAPSTASPPTTQTIPSTA